MDTLINLLVCAVFADAMIVSVIWAVSMFLSKRNRIS